MDIPVKSPFSIWEISRELRIGIVCGMVGLRGVDMVMRCWFVGRQLWGLYVSRAHSYAL